MRETFDTNLIELHSVVIEILSISCFVLFLFSADGSHLETHDCKKSYRLQARITVKKIGTVALRCSQFHIIGNGSHPDWYIFFLIFRFLQLNAKIILTQFCSYSFQRLLR